MLAAGVALLGGVALTAPVAAATAQEFTLVYFGAEDLSAVKGVQQGVDEGNQQGQFLGQRYVLKRVPPDEMQPIRNPAPSAILAAVGAEELRLLAELNPGVPVFNLTEELDDLRALCLPNLLHVIPSERMRGDAVAQWRKLHADSTVRAVAWHPAFTKYAGRQLNNRFSEAQHQGMDDYSWAGWAATKMVTDSIARLQAPTAAQLLTFLRQDLAFDGQKGVTMNFRDNGQLRQVLLLVEGDAIVGEAPVKGVADPSDLDSLGFGHCPQAQ